MSADYQLEAEREMIETIVSQERPSTQRAGYRRLTAKYAGTCDSCGSAVPKGATILYNRRHELRLLCLECGARADTGENLERHPDAPERLTTRERLEAKAERRREWADSRSSKATSDYTAGRTALEAIPFGQPVHGVRDRNYRDKATRKLERSWEHSKMAEHHESAAAGLESQLRASIYDDDPDAIERLEAKLARLEAERDRWKAYNRRARAGDPNGALEELDTAQRADILGTLRTCPAFMGRNGTTPGYVLTNLGATIRTTRQRLERLQRQKG